MAVAPRLAALTEQLLGAALPLRLRAWDGSETGPPGGPVIVVRHRRALRRLLFKPGELGLARAWVAGEIDVEGDLYAALGLLLAPIQAERDIPPRQKLTIARELVRLAGPAAPVPPPPPREEVARRTGPLHSLRRDRQAISHHYDVGNAFYELVLGPSMVYSCAVWDDDTDTLEAAQTAKLDLICRKLGLREGQRLLDVGCGWGSLVLHAARHYGVRAVGVTLSEEQAVYARERVAKQGLGHLVEIRVQDYRETADGPFDAISSVGMAEHVGAARYREYAERLYGLLRPGGRLLNHQIARPPRADESSYRVDPFIDAYVFPDGELAPVGRTVTLLERAGFEVRDVESLREHYALTLRRWVHNLEARRAEATRLAGAGRARVWRLYMAASALSFERAGIGVNQVLAVRLPVAGGPGLPLRPRAWTERGTVQERTQRPERPERQQPAAPARAQAQEQPH
ncbi:cyclopropane-fatty-acyl-phospholipid synthase family protein [Streptomyces johnsoniae]|uniref:Cyclopropane-fatty-acyl-phospholipid synthase family protein n=1 Tax=Streptomyces johnsoniae TaxID=3075532 RepID=A0ABU2RY53_9ACTN|nr:cyclopropane-fatty-acyl-phospholipid synthase family protein [Streptomyces sp. DSM 41886]MDT0441672.1 cyclopropane-fatty-acyl-phospholipid synthase family protein [Streptomyces sp. DSM 41886]